jgi:hypothetical protein
MVLGQMANRGWGFGVRKRACAILFFGYFICVVVAMSCFARLVPPTLESALMLKESRMCQWIYLLVQTYICGELKP